MNTFRDLILYLLVTATMQNMVITTGFGSSSLARMLRRPRQRRTFSKLLLGFTLATTVVFYPIDALVSKMLWARALRPLVAVIVTALVYVAAVLICRRKFANWYHRVHRFFPLAAFNSIVIGVALIANYQSQMGFLPAVGIAVGSSLGFSIISAMSAEALERMDNPDTPQAFRGLPGVLVYLGLLALALMGFEPLVRNLI